MDNIQPKNLSDAEILAVSLKQPSVFSELVERYEKAFLRKAVSILRDEEDARDAVQETFVRVYAAASKYHEQAEATFASWAYAILTNQCYTTYRKRQKHQAVSFEADPELAEVLPDQAGINEFERRLDANEIMVMLSRLPLLLRRAVEQHFLDGLPEKEIARREGVSHGTIRQRIYRAKQQLRELALKPAYQPANHISPS